jgi:hypothetical protein
MLSCTPCAPPAAPGVLRPRAHPASRSRTRARLAGATCALPRFGARDPVRSRGDGGHQRMCDELVLELVCSGVARETERDETWAAQRLEALSALLGCSLGELARLGRTPQLAALCALDDALVVRRLIEMRVALPPAVDAGRLAAAAPSLLLPEADTERRGLGRAYAALAAMFAPSAVATAALPATLLETPELLASVAGVARALTQLREEQPACADVAALLLTDSRLLADAQRS